MALVTDSPAARVAEALASTLSRRKSKIITMQTELLKVRGMTCGGCIGTITRALQAVTGLGGVNVSLSVGEAAVQYDERLTSPEQREGRGLRCGCCRGEAETKR